MIKVGITGGIGSGKSTVCKVFRTLGAKEYNTDVSAKRLMQEDNKLRDKISQSFGENVYDHTGRLQTKILANIVFADNQKLELLNSIVHPAVGEDFKNWLKMHQNEAYIIKEAALMFESNSYLEMDYIISVTAPENIRIKRIMERDEVERKRVISRMEKQFTDAFKITRSHYVLYNDNQSFLLPQIIKLDREFRSGIKNVEQLLQNVEN